MVLFYSQNYAARALLILFNTPKKSLLKSSYPSQIFVTKKILESKISNPKKSFDHTRHLKSRVPPLPPWVYSARVTWNNGDENLSRFVLSNYQATYWLCLKIKNKKVCYHCPLFCRAWFLGQSTRRLCPLMGLLQTVQFLVLPPLDDCAVAAAASWARTTDTASKIGKIYLVHLDCW